MPSALDGTRIVVAGAGLAGLTAAHALTRRGASVHVIEARDRIGGRVWTIRDPVDGLHVEAGGEFIDEEHTDIRRLAAELRLPLVRVLKRGFGLAVTVGRRVRVTKSQQDLWKDLARILRRPIRAYKSAGCDWGTTAAAAIARHSVAAVLDAGRASLRAKAGAEALRGFYLADPDRLSALVLVDQIVSTGNPGRPVMYRVAGGADRLAESLARSVHGRVWLGHVVRGVTQHPHGVRVAMEDPAGRHTQVDADYAVIALPAALVASCHFAPSLPKHQLRALKSLQAGAATKLSLRFGEKWRRNELPRAFGTNLDVGAVWEGAEEQDIPVLTFLAGASASAQLLRLFDKEGPDGLVARLPWLGLPRGGRVAAAPVCWERERWSRGGYAVFPPGFDPRLRPALQASHGRVVFAGEHTSRRWQGFMNGAVESGLRAVAEIQVLEQLT